MKRLISMMMYGLFDRSINRLWGLDKDLLGECLISSIAAMC